MFVVYLSGFVVCFFSLMKFWISRMRHGLDANVSLDENFRKLE